jgi:nucleoporin POM152
VGNVRYTLTPLGYVEGELGVGGKIEYVELNQKELKAIEGSWVESLQIARSAVGGTNVNGHSKRDTDDYEYDEYDDEEDQDNYDDSNPNSHSSLSKTQSLTHIRIKKPGTVRLERVLDPSNIAARLSHPLEVTVVPCPTASFAPADKSDPPPVRCAGSDSGAELKLTIDIKGVPPLSLRWFKEVNGRREHFLVEGIEDEGHERLHGAGASGEASEQVAVVGARRKTRVMRELKVPLEVSLDAVGTHTYVLEEVIDGVGNAVVVEHPHTKPGLVGHTNATTQPTNTPTSRTLAVLRRPTISFKHCTSGNPTPLLIGSEAPLTISANDADILDAPWEVAVKYSPPELDGAGKRYKAWKKSLSTQGGKKELVIRANAPGKYTIIGVKGKVG